MTVPQLSSDRVTAPSPIDKRLLGLTWSHFLNDGAANYLPGILPAVLVSLHEPVKMAGILMAALMIGQALQPLMGWISDRLGGRSMLMIGLLFSSIGGALLGVATYTSVFIGLLLLIGVGNAMFHPQSLALVRLMVRDRQGLSTSLFLIGGELGRGIWPTIASLIVVHFGLPSLWLFAVPAILTTPFLLLWAPKLPARKGRGQSIQWTKHLYPMSLLVGFAGFRAFVTLGMVTFIPIMWHFHGGTLVSGATIITTLISVGVIGNLGGGHLTDRLGRRPILLLSVAGTTILIPLVAVAHGPWIWVAAAFLGMALFLSASTNILIGQDIFPENRSMGSGIALGLGNGIGAMLVFVTGFWSSEHDITALFGVLTVASVLSGVFALLFPKALVRKHSSTVH